ncbi:hypothetical protein KEM52_003062, partial [Ascosphaera acerosa]
MSLPPPPGPSFGTPNPSLPARPPTSALPPPPAPAPPAAPTPSATSYSAAATPSSTASGYSYSYGYGGVTPAAATAAAPPPPPAFAPRAVAAASYRAPPAPAPASAPAPVPAAVSTAAAGFGAYGSYPGQATAAAYQQATGAQAYAARPPASSSTAPSLPYRSSYSAAPQLTTTQTSGTPHAASTAASGYQAGTGAGAGTGAYSHGRYNNNRHGTYRAPPHAYGADYDPETEAAIAQWQSAYLGPEAQAQADAAAGAAGLGPGGMSAAGAATPSSTIGPSIGPAMPAGPQAFPQGQAASAGSGGAGDPDKTVVRSGGGQKWTDSTLLEWDPAHFRLFVGNLAGEVTDETLLKAFGKYASVSKARVIRDKRTEKSRGYGFVSFADGDDYFRAARDMQGKYIGSHPVLLKKAVTEIKAVPVNALKKGLGGGKALDVGKVRWL